jgi:hypothetical protein
MTVTIDPALVEQLKEENGLKRRSTSRAAQRHHALHGPHGALADVDAKTRSYILRSHELQSSLITSRIVGDLLLKHEDRERALVERRTRDLLAGVQGDEARKICEAECKAVVECYERFTGDELQCAAVVAAYQQCANCALGR